MTGKNTIPIPPNPPLYRNPQKCKRHTQGGTVLTALSARVGKVHTTELLTNEIKQDGGSKL